MKLRCDGSSPCSSCQRRNLECNNERKAPSKSHELGSQKLALDNKDSRSTQHEGYEKPSDRGSIKFLLNGGMDSFTEQFRLPPSTDRARGLEYHNQKGFEEAERSILGYPIKEEQPEYTPALIEPDPATLSFFQDNFISFLHGPFGDPNKDPNPYGSEIAYQALLPPGQDPNLTLPGEQPSHDFERPFAIALIHAILTRAWTVLLDPRAQEEMSANVHFLLTTARIQKFVSLYFKFWHPNCPIIHIASFDPEMVSLPLLASVVFMGAIYSDDMRESGVAKRVLDFAELFVFSNDVFSFESEIGANFCTGRTLDDEPNELVQFQNLQAGYIMLVTQYWAGRRVSRNRAMEIRFGEVVSVCFICRRCFHSRNANLDQVARKIGLPKCRHQVQDQIHECLWIQNESRIR